MKSEFDKITDLLAEKELYKSLLNEFLTLGHRWAFNEMKPTAQKEFLDFFGKVREAVNEKLPG